MTRGVDERPIGSKTIDEWWLVAAETEDEPWIRLVQTVSTADAGDDAVVTVTCLWLDTDLDWRRTVLGIGDKSLVVTTCARETGYDVIATPLVADDLDHAILEAQEVLYGSDDGDGYWDDDDEW